MASRPEGPPTGGRQFLKWFLFFLFLIAGSGFGVLYAHLRELPDIANLNEYKPSQATRIYDVHGRLISQLWLEKRTVIPLEKMPAHLLDAVIAIEDERFYQHWGVDLVGILRAFLTNVRHGGIVEGASTITQQLARNLFLTRERTLARKVREALLAIQIERNFSKDQILEMYLNQIYFGAGAYGVESAARTYFGKHAEDLDPAESALLAGLPKAPSAYDPYKHPLKALDRRNTVLTAMAEKGFLTLQEATELKGAPLELKKIEVQNAPYFVEYVRQQLEARYGADAVYRGGLTVTTTLDLAVQESAQRILLKGLEEAEERARRARDTAIPLDQPIQGALLAVDVKTGAIRVMIGGRDYQESVFNRAVQAERQPGSAFKPFIYAAALENGFTLADVILDAPIIYRDPDGREWRPVNYSGRFHGNVTLHTALMYSINVPTIKLLERLGTGPVVNLVRRLGITARLEPNLSLGLGTSEVTLLEMVQAYSVFANQGIRTEPFAVLTVKDASGRVLESNSPSAQEVVDPQTCALMVHAMKDVVDHGTGRVIRRLGFTRPAAGKTGTTNNNIDAWFIGFTPELACGVWVGYDERQSLGRRQTGGATAAPIWAEFMKAATAGTPVQEFVRPEGLVEKRVCLDTGMLPTTSCRRVRLELFRKDTVPVKTCPQHGGGGREGELEHLTGGTAPHAGDILEMEAVPLALPTPRPDGEEEEEAKPAPAPLPTAEPVSGDLFPEEGF